ncbi:MAG: hypothetical protein ACXAEU_26240 [Candidatus Hodarchaeales archaeon]
MPDGSLQKNIQRQLSGASWSKSVLKDRMGETYKSERKRRWHKRMLKWMHEREGMD